MSAPSYRKINYALRPAKSAQRRMLTEAFAQLARIAPLHTYRYIGLGAIGFHDFSLFHQRLGIKDMISVEGKSQEKRRFSFNRPYSCIRIQWGLSHRVLPVLSWTKRTILWLDYEDPLNRRMLGDIALAASSLRSGSMMLVTIPCAPLEVDIGMPTHSQRMKELIERVGSERVPISVTGADLAGWGTARVSRTIIDDQIRSAIDDRNAASRIEDGIRYRQLFNFQYADGKRMLTVGGLLTDSPDSALMSGVFSGLGFVMSGKSPFRIEVPNLTRREIRFLDSRLPVGSGNRMPRWIPLSERRRYVKLYRWFADYGIIET